MRSAESSARRYCVPALVCLVVSLGLLTASAAWRVSRSVNEKNVVSWEELSSVTGDEIVPRIIHTTWKTDQLPAQWQNVSRHCQELHPDYDFVLWTDATSEEFIAAEFPQLLPTYKAYPHAVMRADAFRYAVLARQGGIWLDPDIGCQKPLDPLLHFDLLFPLSMKFTEIWNDMIVAAPDSPFLLKVVDFLPAFSRNYYFKKQTVSFSTGLNMLAAVYALYPKEQARQIRFLNHEMYGRYPPPQAAVQPKAFFQHYWSYSWGDPADEYRALIAGRSVVALSALLIMSCVFCCFQGWRKRPAVRL